MNLQKRGLINLSEINSCYNCEKYPLCSQYREIIISLEKWSIVKNFNEVLEILSKKCSYFSKKRTD
jgi:hypothetical protein